MSLTAAEQRQLEKLLEKSGMAAFRSATPGPKVGSKYQALANLSVPMPGNDDRTSLVTPGNTCILTDEEAGHFLGTCGDAEHASRRQHPMIRPAAEQNEPHQGVRPLHMSGPIRRPPDNPPPGYDGPRADPAGSSRIAVLEAIEGLENSSPEAGSLAISGEDALDIAPGVRIGS